jgi:hypothetical protein
MKNISTVRTEIDGALKQLCEDLAETDRDLNDAIEAEDEESVDGHALAIQELEEEFRRLVRARDALAGIG